MFQNKDSQAPHEAAQANNILGRGTTFKGNVETFGNIRIEGKVIGDILTQSKAAIGSTALIEGKVVAKIVEVEGEVLGTVTASEMLILKSSAKVKGDIHAAKLTVEPGATFDGQCKMGPVAEQKLELTGKEKLQKAS